MQRVPITLTVNGRSISAEVEARMTLADFLREQLGLTGTKLGCEYGVCGSCSVLWDGAAVRSCLVLAAQADGANLTTIEGLATGEAMHAVQQAFWEHHGLQCGFCTPGMVLTAVALLEENPDPSEQEIREALSGNLCRCTGYQNIVRAVRAAAEQMQAGRGS
ncbi:MAG: (2Fe-2S)-binding protein [Thermomicrobium sp.]|uniref:(2Fe-2S)-binding protein n=1 Tax=Thermomicrobium sp. TaxID=1969469 RepID=UPI001B021DC7|nr:2Fe-2S iron-sulfur cluster-binding protein [Thermomicrobium sp.]MBO9359541.1 (2Fe-2S)-binding protein [Thermomicrobium sp.]